MPELPEVEVCRQGLLPCLHQARITQVVVRTPRLRQAIPEDLPSLLTGGTIRGIERRGKYLLFQCIGDQEEHAGWLIVHLGMSGSLRIVQPGSPDEPPQKHDHVDIALRAGALQAKSTRWILRYRDPRRFGLILWHADENVSCHPLLIKLGIEPLDEKFDGAWLHTHTRQRITAIKVLLMDSHFIVGVGNIYANEALFRAGLSPLAPAGKLTVKECERLYLAIRETLTEAIAAGGSTIRDYVQSDGSAGNFQLDYAVYARKGEPCPRCRTAVEQIRQGGRSTFYCPRCQK